MASGLIDDQRMEKLESSLKLYFSPEPSTTLSKAHHYPFRRPEDDHDLTDYWAFFRLPSDPARIRSAESIPFVYGNGENICTLAGLLEYNLECTLELVEESEEERFKVGFLKLFRHRTSAMLLDAYLHHSESHTIIRVELSTKTTEKPFTQESLKPIVVDLARSISSEAAWNSLFVGFTIDWPHSSNSVADDGKVTFELWTTPKILFNQIPLICKSLTSWPVWSKWDVEAKVQKTTVQPAKKEAVLQTRAKFLEPTPTSSRTDEQQSSESFKEPWMLMTVDHPQNNLGAYENAKFVHRLHQTLSNLAQFDLVYDGNVVSFPGLLSKSSSTVFYRRDALTTDDMTMLADAHTNSAILNFCPTIHSAFKGDFPACQPFVHNYEVFRRVCEYLALHNDNSLYPIDAVFAHFTWNEAAAVAAAGMKGAAKTTCTHGRLVLEFWVRTTDKRYELPKAFQTRLRKYVMTGFI